MLLEGSCHCGAVKFRLQSRTPYPYMRCYCTICRKTQGGGGYAINIMGQAKTLKVEGKKHLGIYQARIESEKKPGKYVKSPGRRYFCRECGSSLYVQDPRWAEWVYPFASAIDTPLPKAPETVHMMLNYAEPWADVPKAGRRDRHFPEYPEEGIADWHKARGLYSR
ncbi:MAG: GFA family protein [Betaproteobacteria bacterium]|nr:GFA family protein [Betaproteobacteria bacterium]